MQIIHSEYFQWINYSYTTSICYQGKCLNLVENKVYQRVKKAQLDALLQETGCLPYFAQLASKIENKRKVVQSKICTL